jgi:hypothetical protein
MTHGTFSCPILSGQCVNDLRKRRLGGVGGAERLGGRTGTFSQVRDG